MTQIEKETVNIWEYKVGNNVNTVCIANFGCLGKPRMETDQQCIEIFDWTSLEEDRTNVIGRIWKMQLSYWKAFEVKWRTEQVNRWIFAFHRQIKSNLKGIISQNTPEMTNGIHLICISRLLVFTIDTAIFKIYIRHVEGNGFTAVKQKSFWCGRLSRNFPLWAH